MHHKTQSKQRALHREDRFATQAFEAENRSHSARWKIIVQYYRPTILKARSYKPRNYPLEVKRVMEDLGFCVLVEHVASLGFCVVSIASS